MTCPVDQPRINFIDVAAQYPGAHFSFFFFWTTIITKRRKRRRKRRKGTLWPFVFPPQGSDPSGNVRRVGPGIGSLPPKLLQFSFLCARQYLSQTTTKDVRIDIYKRQYPSCERERERERMIWAENEISSIIPSQERAILSLSKHFVRSVDVIQKSYIPSSSSSSFVAKFCDFLRPRRSDPYFNPASWMLLTLFFSPTKKRKKKKLEGV